LILFTILCISIQPALADEPAAKGAKLNVEIEQTFTKLRFEYPLAVLYAPDDSNRLFVVAQRGKIHAFENRPDAEKSSVFMNIADRVVYKDKENEEGLLGAAFHPKFRENGLLYVYYTTTKAPHTSVISRFRLKADDPNQIDPASEEEIFRLKQPYWNHNGGTIVFGPDGYLYVGLGDGGSANDPDGNGQNLKTLLGSILRIDVDRAQGDRKYAIPADNPFIGRSDARPEIWAYGLRNVWRMAFDRETDLLWAGDVGQNTWEEIDIIRRGGNYGWNLRESKHSFGAKGVGPRDDLIEPIWEYHHDVGKSITGGHVYRGKNVPDLVGKYLYADYVTGKVWALDYDVERQRVVANHELPGPNLPVTSFGEDADGESYFTIRGGQVYTFRPAKP
jgi:quinoprotein glucose dehydrogenase